MQLGMIGLGRMGANLVRRLMRDGHECVVYDVGPDAVAKLEAEGAIGSTSLDEFVHKLAKPRAAWVMIPPASLAKSSTSSRTGSIQVTSSSTGATRTTATTWRARRSSEKDIHYVDVGTSGGVFGLERGFCLMIGGEDEIVSHLDPIFRTLAPGEDAATPTPGRSSGGTAQHGYLHCGPHGAGHFVKMITTGSSTGSWLRMPKA